MVRSLHRAWSRCKAGASSGLTTRKGISTPLGKVSVWSLFMPIILSPFVTQKVDSWNFALKGFSEVLSLDPACPSSQGPGVVDTYPNLFGPSLSLGATPYPAI